MKDMLLTFILLLFQSRITKKESKERRLSNQWPQLKKKVFNHGFFSSFPCVILLLFINITYTLHFAFLCNVLCTRNSCMPIKYYIMQGHRYYKANQAAWLGGSAKRAGTRVRGVMYPPQVQQCLPIELCMDGINNRHSEFYNFLFNKDRCI